MFIDRYVEIRRLRDSLERARVVLLVGPRQAGKTTLAHTTLGGDQVHYFDAENPTDRVRMSDPLLALGDLVGTVVIDEAQLVTDLFPILRVLADRPQRPARFLVMGSASADLVGLTAQSLAGRVEIIELGGFRLADLGPEQLDRLWVRGGLPEAFTARNSEDANAWIDNYITTFLSTDLPQLGSRVPTTTMRRAWTMLSHYHGQTWNGAEFARALDVDAKSARHYLDQLTDALVVRQLLPWFVNTAKRQVKSPKIYIRDSGVLHRLQSIDRRDDLLAHPKVGASWEGLIVEQVGMILGGLPMYHWRTQQGAELDLFTQIGGRNYGLEIKRASAPQITKSIRIALEDLDLAHLAIVYPGTVTARLDERVTLVAASHLLQATTPDEMVARIRAHRA